jgi:hypothetical protein
LSVLAAGTGPLRYQWKLDEVELLSATNSSLTISEVQPSNAGAYTVEVSNSAGAVTSAPAVVAVDVSPPVPPAIVQGPPRQMTIPEGAQGALSVVAAGTEPLTYQWRTESGDIPGATNSTFIIANTFYGAGAGFYSVVISNEAGSAVTQPTQVQILRAEGPTILQQPQSITVRQGETAVFSVRIDDRWPAWYSWGPVSRGCLMEAATCPMRPAQPS